MKIGDGGLRPQPAATPLAAAAVLAAAKAEAMVAFDAFRTAGRGLREALPDLPTVKDPFELDLPTLDLGALEVPEVEDDPFMKFSGGTGTGFGTTGVRVGSRPGGLSTRW